MAFRRSTVAPLFLPLAIVSAACGGEIQDTPGEGGGGSPPVETCADLVLAFEAGDPDGHADPLGAAAAGQARAGRIQAADVPPPAHGRQGIQDGDFLLINDKIAVVIEDQGLSDSYGRFGGEILSVDRVGEDGQPLGLSKFLETIQLTSLYQIDPTSVSVMNDGSNGEAAVLRVAGTLKALPFLAETFGAAFPKQHDGLTAAYDFILEPGAEKLVIRYGLINATDRDVDTGASLEGSLAILGFFQASQNKSFLPGLGFVKGTGSPEYVAFENDTLPFAYQGPNATPLDFGGIDIGGFQTYTTEGVTVAPCSVGWFDDHEIVVGEPGGGVDLLGEAVRRANGLEPWREITGVVTDAAGAPVAGAYVHAEGAGGAYFSRATTGADGAYAIHVPEGEVTLTPSKQGYPHVTAGDVGGATTLNLELGAHGLIEVTATEEGSGVAIPVRVQVIPEAGFDPTPEAWGAQDEANGRLWQEFAVDGTATLAVPPGAHQVIVSRGYEWELYDQRVDVPEGATTTIDAVLAHSVDTTGAVSADFHIHSMYSPDSSDPTVIKVKCALADGLDVPVSSEHDWVIDFQPYIEDLGATQWARGLPAEELTTFTWGHFGVVPLVPKPGELNNGAIDWLGKSADEVFSEVRALAEDPALIVHHPSRDTAFQAYFRAVEYDRATASSDDPNWSENFDAIEVFNHDDFVAARELAIADWFSLLDAGKIYWAVGSSDSHEVRTDPIGYPRNYLFLGTDDLSTVTGTLVAQSIKQGNSTVGGGLFMTVVGPDASGPGDAVPFPGGTADFTVTVQCPSWVDADTLEVIVNGETVSEEPLLPIGAGPGKRFVNTVSLALPAGPRAYVLFHAKGDADLAPLHPGKRPFAMSNPILFQR